MLDVDRRSKALISFDSEGSNDDAEKHTNALDLEVLKVVAVTTDRGRQMTV